MEQFPILNPFNRFFNQPLTSEDIEEIEEGLDILIEHLFEDAEEREDALSDDLVDKIEGYITIADHIESDPDLKEMPGAEMMGPALRELLQRVREYNLRAN